MKPRHLVSALALGCLFLTACSPRRGVEPTLEDNRVKPEDLDAKPIEQVTSEDSTPKEPAAEMPEAETPVDNKPVDPLPADVTLTWSIDGSKLATECPNYQTHVPGKNSFTVQHGEIGDIIAKATASSRVTCTLRGQVVIPPGYWVDLNIDSLNVLGSAVLGRPDSLDYSIKVETYSGLYYIHRYEKIIIGPRNGPFEATLDTLTPTLADPPCSKDPVSVPFNIVIQSTLRAATTTTLAEVEGFMNRMPGFKFRYRACKP